MQLNNDILNRVVITCTTYWDDGKCELESSEAHAIIGKICAVRRTKRKKQPFAVDVMFPAYDQHEESICEISLDHVMKMIQPAHTDLHEIGTSAASEKVAVADASENVTEAETSEICMEVDASENVARATSHETILAHQDSSSSSDDDPIALLSKR